ncbi:MAG: GNAT family N-acetyltransferase [Pseudomonadota bacterium]
MADPIILRTRRLLLRPPLPDDAAQIAERIGVKEVAWNLGRAPYPYKKSDADDWIERVPQGWVDDTAYVLLITHEMDGVIGCVGLDLKPMDVWEIGYWLGKPWWGRGYVTEATAAVMDWAETAMELRQFASGHFTDNPASGKVLKKLGFVPVGETELFGLARGRKDPCVRYSKGTDANLALKLVAH